MVNKRFSIANVGLQICFQNKNCPDFSQQIKEQNASAYQSGLADA